jgi:hypothetical protein
MDTKGCQLRTRFIEEAEEKGPTAQMLIVAVKLPTGAVELITNTAMLHTKIDYYKNAYNEEFKLKGNINVQIVGFMFV